MGVSPSQLTVIDRCPRRWWFDQVLGLEVANTTPQTFGHALHEVCAARLQSVAPPASWTMAITEAQVQTIGYMVDAAVDSGVLVPRAGLLIEHAFSLPIKGQHVSGRIDVVDLVGVVEDHKLVATDRWAKTEADLLVDIPMMVYGGYLLSLNKALQEVVLRHNQFILDERSVKVTKVTVSAKAVREFWSSRVVPLLNTVNATRPIERWEDVAGHPLGSPPCGDYGGCPFANICHRGLAVEKFGEAMPADPNGAPF